MMRKIFLPGAVALLIGFGGARVARTIPVPLGSEFPVNTDTAGDQQAARVATCQSGAFVVVWQGPETGGSQGIFARLYLPSGAPATGQFKVNSTIAGDQIRPSVAMIGNCEFVVAWEGPDASAAGIFARRFLANGTPATDDDIPINGITAGAQTDPVVAFIDDGDILVAWRSGSAGAGDIVARVFQYSFTPKIFDFTVNKTTEGNQEDPAVVSTEYPEPVYYVVWEGPEGGSNGKGIFLQQIGRKGLPVGGEVHLNQTLAGDQENPAVAASNYGHLPAFGALVDPPDPNFANRVVVVWQGPYAAHANRSRIFFRQLDIGGNPIGDEKVFAEDFASPAQSDPDVGMGDSPRNEGDDPIPFVAVWSQVDEETPSVQGAIFITGGKWPKTNDVPLAYPDLEISSRTYVAGSGAVSSMPTGDFVGVWQNLGQDAGGSLGIAARRFQDSPQVTLTKVVTGVFELGAQAIYTVDLVNHGTALADHDGDDLIDVLPASLQLQSASATSGTIATLSNTVRWNGALPSGGRVRITIRAAILVGSGIIASQASFPYDFDHDGSYETQLVSDDPAVNGSANSTRFTVGSVVFEDGFEAGDTTAWSLTFP